MNNIIAYINLLVFYFLMALDYLSLSVVPAPN